MTRSSRKRSRCSAEKSTARCLAYEGYLLGGRARDRKEIRGEERRRRLCEKFPAAAPPGQGRNRGRAPRTRTRTSAPRERGQRSRETPRGDRARDQHAPHRIFPEGRRRGGRVRFGYKRNDLKSAPRASVARQGARRGDARPSVKNA